MAEARPVGGAADLPAHGQGPLIAGPISSLGSLPRRYLEAARQKSRGRREDGGGALRLHLFSFSGALGRRRRTVSFLDSICGSAWPIPASGMWICSAAVIGAS